MRIHEVALQRWFYSHFFVTEGYPVPLVFATPMDAFSTFQVLWGSPDNPFTYLLEAKDSEGRPLYEPYPATVRYPLISVSRKGMSYRPEQSYGTHTRRRAYYVTLASNVTQADLGNVVSCQMPTAWNFTYQIDHYCTRPDTQAIFIQKLMKTLRFGGGTPQTWIPVIYPAWFGTDHRVIRMYVNGGIDTISNEEPGDAQVEYRTSFTVVLEGYSPDLDVELNPTLWTYFQGTNPVTLDQINNVQRPPIVETTEDLRVTGYNPVFNELADLPPKQ